MKFEFFEGDTEITDPARITISGVQYETCGGWGYGGSPATVSAAGKSVLRYDTAEGHFVFNWKTPASGCYAVTATSDIGSSITAQFEIRWSHKSGASADEALTPGVGIPPSDSSRSGRAWTKSARPPLRRRSGRLRA